MAITKLPVDFKDDIINTEINDKRRYNLVENTDGTVSLEDMTTYEQVGNDYGQAQINALNGTVNEVIDAVEAAQDDIKNIENGSTVAEAANKLATARKINGVDFDGTQDITVHDATKLSKDEDFILLNQGELAFSEMTATIEDARITEGSLADVYFTADTIAYAEEAGISVEAISGAVVLTAVNAPTGTIKATIHIRVV